MPENFGTILNDPVIRREFREAWIDSQPGITGGREQGGFILRNAEGESRVLRWPRGKQNVIELPQHTDCKVGDEDIVASFHTHPNTGKAYVQEPSNTDRRAVREDRDLKGEYYLGEIVLSRMIVYLIAPDGRVSEVAAMRELLSQY